MPSKAKNLSKAKNERSEGTCGKQIPSFFRKLDSSSKLDSSLQSYKKKWKTEKI
jgi:hypothetical protein